MDQPDFPQDTGVAVAWELYTCGHGLLASRMCVRARVLLGMEIVFCR
jgi:hypothetical protein